MNDKKKWSPKFLSPAALSLLFGGALVGDVSAMEPVVSEPLAFRDAGSRNDVQQQNNNNGKEVMTSAQKPELLKLIDAESAYI